MARRLAETPAIVDERGPRVCLPVSAPGAAVSSGKGTAECGQDPDGPRGSTALDRRFSARLRIRPPFPRAERRAAGHLRESGRTASLSAPNHSVGRSCAAGRGRSRRQESLMRNSGHGWPRDTLVRQGCYRHNMPIRPSLCQATGCKSLRYRPRSRPSFPRGR